MGETDFDRRVREQGLKTQTERIVTGDSGRKTKITSRQRDDGGTDVTVQEGLNTQAGGFSASGKRAKSFSFDKDVRAEDISINDPKISKTRVQSFQQQRQTKQSIEQKLAERQSPASSNIKKTERTMDSTRVRDEPSMLGVKQQEIGFGDRPIATNMLDFDTRRASLQRVELLSKPEGSKLTEQDMKQLQTGVGRGDAQLAEQTRRIYTKLRIRDEKDGQSSLKTREQFFDEKFKDRPLSRATAELSDRLSRSKPGQTITGFAELTGVSDIGNIVIQGVEDLGVDDSTDPNIIQRNEVIERFSPGVLMVRAEDRPSTRKELRRQESFVAQESKLGTTDAEKLGQVAGIAFDLATVLPTDVGVGEALGLRRFKGVPKTSGILDDTIDITSTGRRSGTTRARDIDTDIISPRQDTRLAFKEKSRGGIVDTTIDFDTSRNTITKTQRQGDTVTRTVQNVGDDFSTTRRFKGNKQVGEEILNPALNTGDKIKINEVLDSDITDLTLKREGSIIREKSTASVLNVDDTIGKRTIKGDIESISRRSTKTDVVAQELSEQSGTAFKTSRDKKPILVEFQGDSKSRLPELQTSSGRTGKLDFEDVITAETSDPDLVLNLDSGDFAGQRRRITTDSALTETAFDTAIDSKGQLKLANKRRVNNLDLSSIRGKKAQQQLGILDDLNSVSTTKLSLQDLTDTKKLSRSLDMGSVFTPASRDISLLSKLGLTAKAVAQTKQTGVIKTEQPLSEILLDTRQDTVTDADTILVQDLKQDIYPEQELILDTPTRTTTTTAPLLSKLITNNIFQDTPVTKTPLPKLPFGLTPLGRLPRGNGLMRPRGRSARQWTVTNKILDITKGFRNTNINTNTKNGFRRALGVTTQAKKRSIFKPKGQPIKTKDLFKPSRAQTSSKKAKERLKRLL